MARGTEGKQRRKNEKKQARKDEAEALLNGNMHEFMAPVEDDDSDDEVLPTSEDDTAAINSDVPPPKKKKRSPVVPPDGAVAAKPKQGIKTLPLILLILMTGTTLLPAMIYASDWIGTMVQKHHILGAIGYKLGMGATPKKRVLSFYEKHDPNKIDDVPTILAKHYGDYPKLIKKLERKYGDYGYFLNWEEDEAPMTLAFEQLEVTRDHLIEQWNLHAPQPVKQGVRNMRYNVNFLYKKIAKVWKKHAWPILEPYFGVPKGAATQKRKDREEARKRKTESSGQRTTRRRNTDYRDGAEDEH